MDIHDPSSIISMGLPQGVQWDTTPCPVEQVQVQWFRDIVDRFGVEAAAIVRSTAIDLNMYPEQALDLLREGDSEFRAACARHLEELRKKAAVDREKRQRQQRHADHLQQRNSLDALVMNLNGLIAQTKQRHDHIVRWSTADGKPLTTEQSAGLDAEREALFLQLEQATAKLRAFDAAPDAAVARAIFEAQ